MDATMTEMKINGVEYVRKDSIAPSIPPPETTRQIVILQRGFVMVGDFKRESEDCTLYNAKVIRRWGTKKGLGELASSGATKDTVFDDAGTVRFHVLTVVARMDVKAGVSL